MGEVAEMREVTEVREGAEVREGEGEHTTRRRCGGYEDEMHVRVGAVSTGRPCPKQHTPRLYPLPAPSLRSHPSYPTPRRPRPV